ncbi:hypothetical protein ACLESO_49275, partial [Pyxidicoccus sp. 3LG]
MSEPDPESPEAQVMSAAVMAEPGTARNVVMPEAHQQLAPEVDAEPVTQPGRARRRDRAVAGDRWIARVLRGGAVVSGGMFVVSLGLEVLPPTENVAVAIDLLRKGAASLLLVTRWRAWQWQGRCWASRASGATPP